MRYGENGRIAVSLNVESLDTYLSGSHNITSHEFWDKPARADARARDNFDAIQNELEDTRAENESLSKQLWMLSNCDETFNENTLDKINSLNLDQIQFLWSVYKGLTHNLGAQGVVSDEEDRGTENEAKEDVREVIFGVRRDGKLKGLRSIREINL